MLWLQNTGQQWGKAAGCKIGVPNHIGRALAHGCTRIHTMPPFSPILLILPCQVRVVRYALGNCEGNCPVELVPVLDMAHQKLVDSAQDISEMTSVYAGLPPTLRIDYC